MKLRPSLVELHDQYPHKQYSRHWPTELTSEDALAAAGNLHEQPDPVAYLSDIQRQNPERVNAINTVLFHLPADVVFGELGESVALWHQATCPLLNNAMKDVLKEHPEHRYEDISSSRRWCTKQRGTDATGDSIIAQYRLMQTMRNTPFTNIDLPSILASHKKSGQQLSDKQLHGYSLGTISPHGGYYRSGGYVDEWSDIPPSQEYTARASWIDSPIGFALYYKDVPNAMGAVALSSLNELMLYQIQGVQLDRIQPYVPNFYRDIRAIGKISSGALSPIDWRGAMIAVNERLSATLGYGNTGIQAGANNCWTNKRYANSTRVRLTLEQAERAYDIPAQAKGYQQRDDDPSGNWHKQILS